MRPCALALSSSVIDLTCIGGGLQKQMGFFGAKHIDKYDSVTGFSTMICNSDLPDGYEGGRFHLLEFGAYVRLDGIKVISFSGLRWHGGTPPLAPDGQDVDSSAYRWVVILYPQGSVISGGASHNVAADHNHQPVQITVAEKLVLP